MKKASQYQDEALRCTGLKATPLISRCSLWTSASHSDGTARLRPKAAGHCAVVYPNATWKNTDPVRLEYGLLISCQIQRVSGFRKGTVRTEEEMTSTHADRSTRNAMTDVLSKSDLQTIDAYWRAANYLSVGQIYLYDNPLLKRPLTKEDVCLDIGEPRPAELHIRTPQPAHQQPRPRRDLRHRSRPRGSWAGRQCIHGRHIYRSLSKHFQGRGRNETIVQAVLVSRRCSKPCRARDTRIDSRGR